MDSLCSKNGRIRVGGAGIDFFHVFFFCLVFFLHAVGCCAHSFYSSSCVLFYAMLFIFMSVSVCAGVCVRLCVGVCVGAARSAQLYSVPLPTFYVFLFICAALQFQKVFACCPRLRWRALA